MRKSIFLLHVIALENIVPGLSGQAKYSGKHFWIRGYFVSTIGRNEETMFAYISGALLVFMLR